MKQELQDAKRLQAQKIHERHPLLCIPKETIDSKEFQFDRCLNARIKLARDELHAKKISKNKDFFHNLSPLCKGTIEVAKPCGLVTGSAESQFTKSCVVTGSSKKKSLPKTESGVKCDSASLLSEEEVDRLCLILARDRDSILDEARNKRTLRKFKKQLS